MSVSDGNPNSEIDEDKKIVEMVPHRTSADSELRPRADQLDSKEKESVNRLYRKIASHLDESLSNERQHELTRVLALLKRCDELNLTEDMKDIDLAVEAIIGNNTNLVFAQGILCNLEVMMLRKKGGGLSRLIATHSKGDPLAVINFGLMASIIGSLALGTMTWAILDFLLLTDLPSSDKQKIFIVGYAAFAGSAISLIMRLGTLSKPRNVDIMLLFWSSALQPFIGAVMGGIICAVLSTPSVSGPIISKDLLDGNLAAWVVIGFISGFSERFATNIISRTETTLGGAIVNSPKVRDNT
jgi:hypothetical protein